MTKVEVFGNWGIIPSMDILRNLKKCSLTQKNRYSYRIIITCISKAFSSVSVQTSNGGSSGTHYQTAPHISSLSAQTKLSLLLNGW